MIGKKWPEKKRKKQPQYTEAGLLSTFVVPSEAEQKPVADPKKGHHIDKAQMPA